ncbi:hypothetical protein B0H17DRAFT_1107900 [Mycena rosella]|uniref:Uncharacterized protein n=1 Tax=Mycena rosella TaxID=1033263 RepID=A0AAD7BY87_MYCRO|nr:hypothetical protein B0H17DRAFT_1107900 [Mycena rosella]
MPLILTRRYRHAPAQRLRPHRASPESRRRVPGGQARQRRTSLAAAVGATSSHRCPL